MRVRELIKELEDVDPELLVFYADYELGYEEVTDVLVTVKSLPRVRLEYFKDDPRYNGRPFLLLQ